MAKYGSSRYADIDKKRKGLIYGSARYPAPPAIPREIPWWEKAMTAIKSKIPSEFPEMKAKKTFKKPDIETPKPAPVEGLIGPAIKAAGDKFAAITEAPFQKKTWEPALPYLRKTAFGQGVKKLIEGAGKPTITPEAIQKTRDFGIKLKELTSKDKKENPFGAAALRNPELYEMKTDEQARKNANISSREQWEMTPMPVRVFFNTMTKAEPFVWGHMAAQGINTLATWAQMRYNPNYFAQQFKIANFEATMKKAQGAYFTLKIKPGTNPAGIRKASHKLVIKLHPDMPGGNRQKFEEVIRARDYLVSFWKPKIAPPTGELFLKGNIPEVQAVKPTAPVAPKAPVVTLKPQIAPPSVVQPPAVPPKRISPVVIGKQQIAETMKGLTPKGKALIERTVKEIDQDVSNAKGTGIREFYPEGEEFGETKVTGIPSQRPKDIVSKQLTKASRYAIARERLEKGYTLASGEQMPPDVDFLAETGQLEKAREIDRAFPIFGPEEYNISQQLVIEAKEAGIPDTHPEVILAKEAIGLYEQRKTKLYPEKAPAAEPDILKAKAEITPQKIPAEVKAPPKAATTDKPHKKYIAKYTMPDGTVKTTKEFDSPGMAAANVEKGAEKYRVESVGRPQVPEVKASAKPSPLTVEARKYKTATEFVEAQGKEYRGQHEAPTRSDGFAKPGHDLTDIYPDDIYSLQGVRYYGDGFPFDNESHGIISSMRGKPNKLVKIYRTIPKTQTTQEKITELEKNMAQYHRRGSIPGQAGKPSATEGSEWFNKTNEEVEKLKALPQTSELQSRYTISPGDWVSINKKYAIQHGKSNLTGKSRLITKTVRADEIFTDGNSMHEWGYDPKIGGTKTTSQLTDIWKKAQGEPIPAKPVPVAKKLRTVQTILEDKHKDLSFFVSENPREITLSKIIVPKLERGKGQGTQFMNDLIKYADSKGKRIVLTPTKDFGGSLVRLKGFYKKLGFVENKGKSRDFTTKESFIREPKPVLEKPQVKILKPAAGPEYEAEQKMIEARKLRAEAQVQRFKDIEVKGQKEPITEEDAPLFKDTADIQGKLPGTELPRKFIGEDPDGIIKLHAGLEPPEYIKRDLKKLADWALRRGETVQDIIEKELPDNELIKGYERQKDIWFGKKDVRVVNAQTETRLLQREIREALKGRIYGDEINDYDKAIQIYLDSKRNPEHIKQYFNQLTPEQQKIVKLSQSLPPSLIKIADKISVSYKKLGMEALSEDVIKNVLDNYTGRIWDLEKEPGPPGRVAKFKTTTGRARRRKLETIIEGWSKGYKLKVGGATTNLGIIKDEIIKTIEDKKFINSLKKLKDMEGDPLLSTIQLEGYEKVEHPNFKVWERVGQDIEGEIYKRAKNFFRGDDGVLYEKKEFYAPKDIAKNLNNILGISKLNRVPLIPELTRFNAKIKAWVLQTSLFHHMAFMRSYWLGTNAKRWGELSVRQAYKQGVKAIEEEDPVVMLGVKNGLTLRLKQDWNEELVQQETVIGKILDKLETTKAIKDAIGNLRKAQADFLFGEFGAGLKAKSFVIEFRNFMKSHPNNDPDEAAKIITNLINDDFGGLHLARMGRNPTVQHIFRLFTLAPDWTESNIRTMVKAFKAGKEGHVYRRFWAGIFTKAMLMTIAANVLLNGKDTPKRLKEAWEEGPTKFRWVDVDITNIYKALGGKTKNRKYFSILGHFKDPIKFITAPVRSAQHKGSFLYRFFHEALSGVDWAGRRFTTVPEFVGLDKAKGRYKTTVRKGKAIHARGGRKWGKLKGQTVTWRPGPKGPLQYDQLPSFILSQIKGSQPIQVQNLLGWLAGEIEGFDAIAKSLGLRVSTTYGK